MGLATGKKRNFAMLNKMFKGAMAAAALLVAPQMASANIIEFDVSDSRISTRNGQTCSHGLFISSFGSGCNQRFSLQDGALFSIDTNTQTGTFTGSAINARGQVASIDLSFSDFLETTFGSGLGFRDQSGIGFNPATDTPDIDFFSNGSGTITVDGRRFSLNPNDPFLGNSLFQFGVGGDDTRDAFEGSAWINLIDRYGRRIGNSDINLALTRRPGVPVPAPAGLGLLALGLMGLGFGLRRRRDQAVTA